MSKKKVAIFATGWLSEIMHQYIDGIRQGFEDDSVDMYIFMCYARYSNSEEFRQGELNIFNLPDLHDFDAAFIFANSIDFVDTLDSIVSRCKEANVPVFCTGKEIENCFFVGSENRAGMKGLCRHLLDEHDAKSFWFIAGSENNMDSNVRMEVVKESLKERGLELKDSDICYTNWEPNIAKAFLARKLDENQSLPDAIICANDSIAMALCGELRSRGLSSPENCLITGFDNEYYAQIYDPSISSINQRFDIIGKTAASAALKYWSGEKLEAKTYVPCEFVPSESCGCTSARDFNLIRKIVARDKFHERLDSSNFDLDLATIEREITKGKTYDDLKDNLTKLYSGFNNYEGNSFHILLDPLYKETVNDQNKNLRHSGYPDKMDVVFSMDKGLVLDIKDFDTKNLVPTNDTNNINRSFILLPLHDEDKLIGYIVFCDDIAKIKISQSLRKYAERMNLVLAKYHRDLVMDVMHQRLLEMTETDGLTHVKNRVAFELKINSMQNKMDLDSSLRFGIVVFDVNNLKRINDQLGHKVGDEYIINACTLICKTYKHSAVYRIGGDEFVVILESDDYNARDELLSSISSKMEELQRADLPPAKRISIASGMAIYNSNEDSKVTDVFKRADAKMYENKSIMKANIKPLSL